MAQTTRLSEFYKNKRHLLIASFVVVSECNVASIHHQVPLRSPCKEDLKTTRPYSTH